MKKILKFLVRGFAVVGFVVMMISVAGWVIILTHEKPHLPDSIILSLDLTKEIPEASDPNPIRLTLGKEDGLTLKDAVAALDLAAKDPRVKVLVGNFRENSISMAAAQELRDAIARLREQGKLSYAYAPSFGEFGAADKAYYLASAFEEIWLQPMGLLGITGLAAQSPFFNEALGKIGAKADFVHREEYKSAMDMLTEDDFTAANAEMLGSILDDLSMQMVNDIAADRELDPLVLQRLIDEAPLTADRALKEKLITHMGYADELDDTLNDAFGEETENISAEDYLSMRRDEIKAQSKKEGQDADRPTVALIHATGQIVQSAEGVAKGDLMAADETVSAIEDAMDDDAVEAILLRIDSPGGSAVASETIRRAIERAQNYGLPVVVSMGDMAGSGGYWVAAQADAIIADPATLTGSIGVIAGKISGDDALWDKLGVHWGMITRGENADLWTVTAPFTDAQRAKVDALVGETYTAFKRHVAESRDLTEDEVAKVAKGRVWTGNQALDNGLVDELGGLYEAIGYTKNLLGLTEDDSVMMKIFPAPESFAERIGKFFEAFGGAGVSMARLNSIMNVLEPVLSPLLSMTSLKPRQLMMQRLDGLR